MFDNFRRGTGASYTLVEYPSGDTEEQRCPSRIARYWHTKYDWVGSASMVMCSLLLFCSVSRYIYLRSVYLTDDICLRQTSAPSPVLEAVHFEWKTFRDDFEPDSYSGYPSLGSENEWAQLWDFGAFGVPITMLPGLNKSSENGDFRMVQAGSSVGGLLEGAHQIHCLNLVRQFIYRDHWDYSQLPSFSGGEKTRRHHVDHCIETLRIVFMCQSDTTPFVFQRLNSSSEDIVVPKGLPKKCRVYSDMVDWVKDHSIFDTIE